MSTVDSMPTQPPPTPRSQSPQDLSNIECLILAQAVYQHGADAWHTVSKLLSKHPSLARPKHFFTPQSCHAVYIRLMSEASLEWECHTAFRLPKSLPDLGAAPQHLKLAQRHYAARLLELRDLIAAEEVKFKHIVAEIDEIRRGAWDVRLGAKLSGPREFASDVKHGASPAMEDEEPRQHRVEEEPTSGDVEEPTTSETVEDNIQLIEEGAETRTSADSEVKPPERISEENASQDEATREGGMPFIENFDRSTTQPADVIEGLAQTMGKEESMEEIAEVGEVHDVTEMVLGGVATSKEREPSVDIETAPPREGKRKASDAEGHDENLRKKKRPREESAPADVDEQVGSLAPRRGTTSSESVTQQQTPPSIPNKRFQTVIGMLHSQISQHRNGNIFHNPIKNSEAPDYHEIIKRPMDLKTIKARVKDGVISNSLEFQRDVYLMFANAMMYNRRESDIYQMAEEMMIESEVHINTFRQTEGFVRSTRS
ncbi:hypothetical protein F5I97DRAFT_1828689 [Phlebopus sp. FC_14]|nr:hypothetical protein F5I97DRAFT_1828689 [Phlebopus sp. FC_14]